MCVSWSYGNSLVYHKAAALDMLGGLDPGFFEGAESHDNDRLRLWFKKWIAHSDFWIFVTTGLEWFCLSSAMHKQVVFSITRDSYCILWKFGGEWC